MNVAPSKIALAIKEKFDIEWKGRIEQMNTTGKITSRLCSALERTIKFPSGMNKVHFSSRKIYVSTSIGKNKKGRDGRTYRGDFSDRKYLPVPIKCEFFDVDPAESLKQLEKVLEKNIQKKNKGEKKKKLLSLLEPKFLLYQNPDLLLSKVMLMTVIKFKNVYFNYSFLSQNKKRPLIKEYKWNSSFREIPQVDINTPPIVYTHPSKIICEPIAPKVNFLFYENEEYNAFAYLKQEMIKSEHSLNFDFTLYQHRETIFMKNFTCDKQNSLYKYQGIPFMYYNDNSYSYNSILTELAKNYTFQRSTPRIYDDISDTTFIIDSFLPSIDKCILPTLPHFKSNFICLSNHHDYISNKEYLPNVCPTPSKILRKRNYELSKKQSQQVQVEYHIIVNELSLSCYLNNKISLYIHLSALKEDVDIIFDMSSCGIIRMSSELNDQFDSRAYEDIIKIINNYYMKFDVFVIIILDDEINKRQPDYDISNVTKRLNKVIKDNFETFFEVINIKFIIKTIKVGSQLNETIITVAEELKGLRDKDDISYIESNKDVSLIRTNDTLNTYEEILLTQFMKDKDKLEEVKEKIKKKYKKFSIELTI